VTELTDLHAAVDDFALAYRDCLIEWRHHLHTNPELSNREVRTAAFVAERLVEAGLDEVRTGIAGHGVVGVLRGGKSGSRVAALRADMDALPVRETSGVDFASTVIDSDYPGGPFPVAHACGHDCHTATVLASAHVLAKVRDSLPGDVLFVFQPSEEGAPFGEIAGAQAMLDAGAFVNPEPTMVFGMHVSPLPKGVVGYRAGNQMAASSLVKITIEGQQVHGSTPWMGVDPMPAAGSIVTAVGQLYRQVPAYNPVTVSIGHIEDVGRFNIVGQTVTLWGTIRCLVEDDMTSVQDKLRRLAEHHAAAYGCTATVEYDQNVPPLTNTMPWLDAVLPTVRRITGERNVIEIPPALGYDDVSVLTRAFGGAYVMFGVQDTEFTATGLGVIEGGRGVAVNHNPGFYADDDILVTSLRIHAHVAIDHLFGIAVPG
jgi:amidohydrolase